MNITEVKVKLADRRSDKLQGFASIMLDGCFVVRDLKIIKGSTGLFVAMPSHKLTEPCPRCKTKNHLRSQFCCECGSKLPLAKPQIDERGRPKLHADIAHPINQACRDQIQGVVLGAFVEELERSKLPGYVPAADFAEAELEASAPVRVRRLGTSSLAPGGFGQPEATPRCPLPSKL